MLGWVMSDFLGILARLLVSDVRSGAKALLVANTCARMDVGDLERLGELGGGSAALPGGLSEGFGEGPGDEPPDVLQQ